MKQYQLLSFFIFFSIGVQAQTDPCAYSPAPCPNSVAITHADDWAERMKDHIALEQGLAFQKKMRNQLTGLLQETAKQNGWSVYELTEEAHDGPPFIFISYTNWEAAPYEKRPPVSDDISFIIIVNKDSLNAWKDWRIQFQSNAEKSMDSYAEDYKKAGEDPLLKIYFDSANYFTQERMKYDAAHHDQYLDDLKKDNKAGLQQHERAEKAFNDKYEYFIKKYQDEQAVAYAGINKSADALQNDEAQHTALFAGSSIVLLHFMINPYLVESGLQDGGQHSLIPQHSLKIDGASYAGLLINKEKPDRNAYAVRDFTFNSPASIASILFGRYQTRDSYNNYRPLFEKSFTSSQATIGSVKNIKCDVLQNLAVHVEGRPDKVTAVIDKMDWPAIGSLIGK